MEDWRGERGIQGEPGEVGPTGPQGIPGRDADIVKFFSAYPRLTIWVVIGLLAAAMTGGLAWASIVYHQIYTDSAMLSSFQNSFNAHLTQHNDEIKALNERANAGEARDIEIRSELTVVKREIGEQLNEIRRDIKELLKRK